MITLYKDGNTHIVRGVACELAQFEVNDLESALYSGWRTTPEKPSHPEPEEPSDELTNEQVRELAKDAGLDNWETGRIKGLKKALEL